MSEGYDEHLAVLHEEWATPPTVVAGLVAEVVDSPVADIRRVVQGEANEVYDVALDGAPSLIVRIAHGGPEALERETWVLGECAARGIRAPRVHALRHVESEAHRLTVMVMEKVQGERLCDVEIDMAVVRRVLEELGTWLMELHSIPVHGFGYLDSGGVGQLAAMEDGLTGLMAKSAEFEAAGQSVGIAAPQIRAWLSEIVESFQATPPRVALIHNDLLAKHVIVRDGRLSGVIDFGEVAAEPVANDFAKWEFSEGERFPVEWMKAGYGDRSLFDPPNEDTYRALWLGNGLWRLRWYYETGFRGGAEDARNRLLVGPGR